MPIIADIDIYKCDPWELPGELSPVLLRWASFSSQRCETTDANREKGASNSSVICRPGAARGAGVVFLLAEGPEVPQRVEAEPGGGLGLLEGHWRGQARRHAEAGGHQEGAGVLLWQGPQRGEEQLDHARVSPGRRRPLRPPEEQPAGTSLNSMEMAAIGCLAPVSERKLQIPTAVKQFFGYLILACGVAAR